MLLAASTALSRDWASYRNLRRFTLWLAAGLATLHLLIAFTPLYDLLVVRLLGVPAEIIEPARLGLMMMTPWSAGTAYRRFQQGVLIRFDQSQAVVWGSLLRVGMDCLVLAAGYLWGGLPGVLVGAGAIIAGVVSEAIYAGWRVRPVLQYQLKQVTGAGPPLTGRKFLEFYIPLAMTVLLAMIVQPMVSAALSRMPQPLESLAVWPVVSGLLLMWQSVGIAYNEAVIALLDKPNAVNSLRRFTLILVGLTTLLLLGAMATPLATFWFRRVAALPPALVVLAQQAMWLGLLLPGLRVLQSWYQGTITYSRHTRGITEAVVVFMLTSASLLVAGVFWGHVTGLYVGLLAVAAGFLTQTLWLWWRGRQVMRTVQAS
jgi:hypothetical protein